VSKVAGWCSAVGAARSDPRTFEREHRKAVEKILAGHGLSTCDTPPTWASVRESP